ncbi:MAG: oligosaccharide flippase family protein [Hyphomicrobiaceae bacterium]|nr:oligosaccharide flippase family protein [Hyphomicrobiaceae bacterium]
MSVKSLVRSTLLLGSSSAANTLIAIVRVKALALLVGPAGLGLLGALSGIAGTATTLFAMGADTSGTRRLALDREKPGAVARLRRALLLLGAIHGAVCMAVFWLAREPISRWVLGSDDYAFQVGLLGPAVAVSLLAGLQISLLQGLGRVADIARVGIASSALGTILGLLAVLTWGVAGLIVLILAQPAIAALMAAASSPPRSEGDAGIGSDRSRLLADWRDLVGEGSAFMLSYLMLALVPLAVRSLVIQSAGLEAAGHFHAAWTMSVVYVGFLLNAMSADYFPRLTGLIGERTAACRLVNDQLQVGLAIGGPILLIMLAGAPWLVTLLYSPAFAPAAGIVEWQALGNLMKIAGWPIAFLAMARGRSVQFMALEVAWTSIFLVLVWLLLPHFGIAATGIGFAIACAAFLVMQTVAAAITYGFFLNNRSMAMLATFAGAGSATLAASQHSALLQAGIGGSLALVLGVTSLRHILTETGADGRIGVLGRRAFARAGWPLPGSPTKASAA